MKFNEYTKMMEDIKKEIPVLRQKGQTIADIAFNITEMISYDYFWNTKDDMPTCDIEQLELAIKNTVLKQITKAA